MLKKVYGKWKALTGRVYNMRTYGPERHYAKLYYPRIRSYLEPPARVLDIGCQYGRFALPLAEEGFRVTATDLKSRYLRYIEKHQGATIELNREDLETTLRTHKPSSYGGILCLELLYNLPEPGQMIQGMAKLLGPGGYLFASHRGLGYYLYRYLREKNLTGLRQILRQNHPDFNWQSPSELKSMYEEAGLEWVETCPIGMFSGYGPDPFAPILHPGKVSADWLRALEGMETDPELQKLFGANARYHLVIARKPTE